MFSLKNTTFPTYADIMWNVLDVLTQMYFTRASHWHMYTLILMEVKRKSAYKFPVYASGNGTDVLFVQFYMCYYHRELLCYCSKLGQLYRLSVYNGKQLQLNWITLKGHFNNLTLRIVAFWTTNKLHYLIKPLRLLLMF